MKVFVLSLQGIGDDEDAYCVSGVYSTYEAAETAAKRLIEEMYDEDDVEEYRDGWEIEVHSILDEPGEWALMGCRAGKTVL
jgi:hypothetical protein